jgi:hypothetical protein
MIFKSLPKFRTQKTLLPHPVFIEKLQKFDLKKIKNLRFQPLFSVHLMRIIQLKTKNNLF